MNKRTILAISPGSRTLGFAVFRETMLIYYGVKTTGRKRSERGSKSVCGDVSRIMSNLIRQFQPTVCALRTLHPIYQQGEMLSEVYRTLQEGARKQGVTIREFAPTMIRQWVCPEGRATKQAVVQEISCRYPELRSYLAGYSQWSRLHYAKLFEAVALGLVCMEQMSRQAAARVKQTL